MPEFRKIVREKTPQNNDGIPTPEEIYQNTLQFIKEAYTLLWENRAVISPEPIIKKLIGALRTQGAEMIVIAHRPPPPIYIPTHSLHVSILSLAIGIQRGLPEPELLQLGIASLLHCCGREPQKKAIEGRYEPLAEEYMKSLEKLDLISDITPKIKKIVREHHERMGKETPCPIEKMEGDIEQETHILLVGDTYCTMSQYPAGTMHLPPHTALMHLLEKGNFPFNPEILKTLIDIVGLYPVGTSVELNNGEIGRVIRPKIGFPMRPLIEVSFDQRGNPLPESQTRDLIETAVLHIRKVIGS